MSPDTSLLSPLLTLPPVDEPQVPDDQAQTQRALLGVGRYLLAAGYSFVTPTPATHARVLARARQQEAFDLRDVFGWSKPFAPDLLAPDVLLTLQTAGLAADAGNGLLRSKLRYSSLDGLLFAHSAYPTAEADAVFFGPDTYRFAALIASELERMPLQHNARILDMGCGAGPGGIVAARRAASAHPRLVLADISTRALGHARANAQLAHREGEALPSFAQGDLFHAVDGDFDLVVSNPPYLNDGLERTYRHGGGAWGGALSERIVREGLPRLAPGGRLVLYTGAAIVDGQDPLLHALAPALDASGVRWTYRELDPDVFGEELEQPAYAQAERIAAVALVAQRPL